MPDPPHLPSVENFSTRCDPRIKLLLALILIIFAALIPPSQPERLIPLLLLLLGIIWLDHLHIWLLLKRFLILAPFLLMAGITLPFVTPGTVAGTLPLLGWEWTWEGWHKFSALLARSAFSLFTLLIFVAGTSFSSIIDALQRLKLPKILVNSLSLLYHYLFVLGDEGEKMLRARNNRWMGRHLLREPLVLGRMAGTLWIRTYLRSERIAFAMTARGGMCGRLVSEERRQISASEWATLTIILILCAFLVFMPKFW